MKVFLAVNSQDSDIPSTIHLALDTAKMSVKAQIAKAQDQPCDPLDEREWVGWAWKDHGNGVLSFGDERDDSPWGEGHVQVFEVLP